MSRLTPCRTSMRSPPRWNTLWRSRTVTRALDITAPFLNGGDPCTPPSSLRSARASVARSAAFARCDHRTFTLSPSLLTGGLRPAGPPYRRPRSPLRRLAPVAWLARGARSRDAITAPSPCHRLYLPGGFAPPDPPYRRPRSPLRRLAPVAWLARGARSRDAITAPSPCHRL